MVSVSLTCTNRELPKQILPGDITGTTGKNASVASFRNITRPTPPLWPVIDGSLHWSLLSAMNLNYLSLLDADALKQVIANFDRHAIHHPQMARLSQQKLDAIERLDTRPVDRLFTGIPVRGLASILYIHPGPFVCEGEMYLLGAVLSHFLSLYASVNSFHMLMNKTHYGRVFFRTPAPVIFSLSQNCCTGWHPRGEKHRNYRWIPLRHRRPFISGLMPAWAFR